MTNGNGYGREDVYDSMNKAREQGGPRYPFIAAGRHKLAVVSMEKFEHRTDGTSVRVLFEVVESKAHEVGSNVVKIFKIMARPKYESSLSEAEQLANLCIALKNAPKGYPIGRDIRTLLEERAQEQLARGTLVECNGVTNAKGTWVNLYWSPIAQTQEQIVAMRRHIEAKNSPAPTPAPAPVQAPASGGFLAQIPPPPSGTGTGNGGGSW